jgi:hypothetical protein
VAKGEVVDEGVGLRCVMSVCMLALNARRLGY